MRILHVRIITNSYNWCPYNRVTGVKQVKNLPIKTNWIWISCVFMFSTRSTNLFKIRALVFIIRTGSIECFRWHIAFPVLNLSFINIIFFRKFLSAICVVYSQSFNKGNLRKCSRNDLLSISIWIILWCIIAVISTFGGKTIPLK